MHPLSASEVLRVWERGYRLHPVDRALAVLAAANPDTSWEQLAHLPVGQRDDLLLSLREQTFGPRLASYAECPECGERLEFEVEAAQMHLPAPAGELSLQCEGYTVRLRLLDSFDLAAAAQSSDISAARRILLERSILAIEPGELAPSSQLPASLENQLVERLAQADPQADVQLDLGCPACGRQWQLTFDIESFLWTEVNNQAKRLLREVHILARAYGWGEAEILSMSSRRRQAYLEMVVG